MPAKQSAEMRRALREYWRLIEQNKPASVPKIAKKHKLHHSSLYRAIIKGSFATL